MSAADSAPPCPVCAREMHGREVEGVAIHGCGTCGGVWLGIAGSRDLAAGELPRQLVALAEAVREFAARLRERGPSLREAPPRIPEGPRRCPFCAEELAPTKVWGTEIEIDVCGHHGTWFDPNELGLLDAHFTAKRARDDHAAEEFAAELARTKGRRSHSVPVLSVLGVPILWVAKDSAWNMD